MLGEEIGERHLWRDDTLDSTADCIPTRCMPGYIYNSYYLGKGKHDPSLFSDVAADLGLPPSAILFVDDNGNNVDRGTAAGIHAIQYVDQESFIKAFETSLQQYR